MVLIRVFGSAKRSGSGLPSRITAVIVSTARTASTTATTVMMLARTVATICAVPIRVPPRSALSRAYVTHE
jgi:hypothetical protein